MASQDLVFASIVTFGMFSTIKAFNSSKNIFFFTSGIWIGLAVIMKTYLTLIPFLSFLPFLISSKIIKNKLFWLGTLAGFLPFIVWSNSIINIHGYEQFSGLYSKLIFLSSKNNSTNPFYYYLWNLPINALPWSIFSIIGFLNIYKLKNKLASYFLFKFPLIMMLLLSMFSTKTPYYPIQILPLLSINSYLGLQYFLKENDFLKITFRKIIFFVFPITILFLLIFLNFKVINIDLENTDKLILSVGLLFFAVTWLLSESIKNIKYKIILIILGPYLLLSIAVQSGFLNDRSKRLDLLVRK